MSNLKYFKKSALAIFDSDKFGLDKEAVTR